MASHTIGIIVNGATGRIGSTQHLANALVPIIAEGGIALGHDRLLPRLLLAGRDATRLAAVARACNGAPWTTDLAAALVDFVGVRAVGSLVRDQPRCRGFRVFTCRRRRGWIARLRSGDRDTRGHEYERHDVEASSEAAGAGWRRTSPS